MQLETKNWDTDHPRRSIQERWEIMERHPLQRVILIPLKGGHPNPQVSNENSLLEL
jgi:hypothetical protein